MSRWKTSLVTLALLVCSSRAQKLTLPDTVKGDVGAFVKVPAATDCKELRWVSLDKGLNVFPVELLKDTKTAVVTAPVAGQYRLMAYGAKGDVPTDPAVCVVVVGEVPPGPGPGPGPNPPVPPPGPSPIPVDGFRVLIVYDTATLGALPRPQYNALQSGIIRDYLNAHCVKGPDGRTAEWRLWDANVNTANEAKLWQDAMTRKRDKLPWVIISTGKAGFEGALPDDTDKFLELLKKFGG